MQRDDRLLRDYDPELSGLLLGVTADLFRSFGSTFGGRHIAMIGGLVPTLWVPDPPINVPPHAGTADIDLHLSLHLLDGETSDYYQTIVDGLSKLGLRPDKQGNDLVKWRWVGKFRDVQMVVEFLCPARTTPGRPEKPRAATVAEHNVGTADMIAAHTVAFGHLVPLDMCTIDRRVSTARGELEFPFPVAGVLPWMCLKSDAIVLRDKPKDAYDVTWVLAGLGPEEVAQRIARSPILDGEHADEAGLQLHKMVDDQFKNIESVGPRMYATFMDDEFERDARFALGAMQEFRRQLVNFGLL